MANEVARQRAKPLHLGAATLLLSSPPGAGAGAIGEPAAGDGRDSEPPVASVDAYKAAARQLLSGDTEGAWRTLDDHGDAWRAEFVSLASTSGTCVRFDFMSRQHFYD